MIEREKAQRIPSMSTDDERTIWMEEHLPELRACATLRGGISEHRSTPELGRMPEALDLAQPARQSVPTGENLDHQPPLSFSRRGCPSERHNG